MKGVLPIPSTEMDDLDTCTPTRSKFKWKYVFTYLRLQLTEADSKIFTPSTPKYEGNGKSKQLNDGKSLIGLLSVLVNMYTTAGREVAVSVGRLAPLESK